MSKRIIRIGLFVFFFMVVVAPYVGLYYVAGWYKNKLKTVERASVVIVNKETMTLSVIDYRGVEKSRYQMACGQNYGNKKAIGDKRTPEGVFHVDGIRDASTWTHDFKDGNGEIQGAYGPWFIRLDTPGFNGIGIHGTHQPESIGNRATEGCIRLKNEDVSALKEIVYIGMPVIIIPSTHDAVAMLDKNECN
ncbi:MAG: L,D-transpeptidase [Bacteroidales bacterium]|nr:L,D-transpeptidase [Bacteroidales bacterium]